MDLLRKLRGVLGLGMIWGVLWAAIFLVLVAVLALFRPDDVGPGEGPLDVWRVGALVGLASGAVFGVLLALAESAHTLRALPPVRAALWGAVASSVFPIVTGHEAQVILMAPLGALLALTAVGVAHAGRLRPLGILFGSAFIADAIARARKPTP